MDGRRLLVHLAVVTVLLMSLPVGAVLPEGTDFEPSHDGVDFPVGWQDFRLDGPFSEEVRMVYPAMEEGEGADMAGNGPFPWVLFFGDSGEAIDGYMLLSERLAQRGFILVVTTPFQDETNLEQVRERVTDVVDVMLQQNQTNPHVMGTAGNIDLPHWGLAGHGKGATAAYLSYPYWNQTFHASTVHPPRALFGLGMDLSDLDEDFSWDTYRLDAQTIQPNTGLFLTGTVDEVAPSQATMERVQEHGGIGWQWMHVLGADHFQFQDSTSIFENEDPTLSQSAQLDLTEDHVVPYLNTVLHGDHSAFRTAFNRAEGPHQVSDPNAYVDEDLGPSAFLRTGNVSSSHNLSAALDGLQTLNLSVPWTLRDGTTPDNLPLSWDVTVRCGWTDETWFANGSLNASNHAVCSYPMDVVAPGVHEAWLEVSVEGAPSTVATTVERTNTPMQLVSPVPTVFVPQRGSAVFNVSEVASDPDGQAVRVVAANLNGPNASHFAVEVSGDGLFVTVTHPFDEEWLGECQLALHLASDGGVVDEANTSLRVLMTEVDDRVRSTEVVPIQEFLEDGDPRALDLALHVEDPEGEPLQLTINDESFGEVGPVRFSLSGTLLTITPLPNQHGSVVLRVMVTDGSTEPLEVTVPLVVNPVNDPVVLNQSMWAGLEVDEDALLEVHLAAWAYDVDGDALAWTVEHGHTELAATVVNGTLRLEPEPDWNGVLTDVWINVSDGGSTRGHPLNVTVAPIGDAPVASISSFQILEGSNTATMQWRVVDADGSINTSGTVLVGGVEVAANHSCLADGPNAAQCVSLLAVPSGLSGSVPIELRLWDEELMRTSVVNFLYDAGGNTSLTTDDGSAAEAGLPTTWVVGGLALLAVGALVLFLTGRSPPEPPMSTRGREEETTPRMGLLERAQQQR